MVNTPCTIKHITLIEIGGGVRYTGKIDKEGMSLPGIQGVADNAENERTYFCANCMTTFDGSETFDEVKKHFGTFPIDKPRSLSHTGKYENDNSWERT